MSKLNLSTYLKRVLSKKETLFFLILSIVFLAIPLLKHAHLESASIVTLIGVFWILFQKESSEKFLSTHFFLVYVSLLPLLISDLFRGCFSAEGLLFWLVIPLPSFFLVHSIRTLVHGLIPSTTQEKSSILERFISTSIVLFIALGLPILELKLNPAVFLYNPIWGFWPGPIYDEQIHFPFQLLIHRFYVILWAVMIWEIVRKKQEFLHIGILFAAISLVFLNFRSLGIIRTQLDLQKTLSTHVSKENLHLYIDSSVKDSVLLNYYLRSAAFHFQELDSILKTNLNEPISIYVYKHPWQKKQLIGAKYTQFTPVWSQGYQLHIDMESWDEVFRHEMVHVLAKSFANSPLGASLNLAVTEGLATALNPSVWQQNTLDAFVAAGGIPEKEEMQTLFSVLGFYLQSSANAYYKSGSFISYLLKNESVDEVKKWYAGSTFQEAFNKSKEELLGNWQDYLKTFAVDSNLQKTARKRFAQPSLFNQDCPRFIHPGYALWDTILFSKAEGDSSAFRSALFKGIEIQDTLWNSFYKRQIFLYYLKNQVPDSALLLKKDVKTDPFLWSDALLLAGKEKELESLKVKNDSLFKKSVLRADYVTHKAFCNLWYKAEFPDSYENTPTELLSIALEQIKETSSYAEIEKVQQVIDRASNTDVLNWLGFLQKRNEKVFAQNCIQILTNRKLNSETKRKLHEYSRYQTFLNGFF